MGWESKKFMHDCNRVKLQKPLAGKAGKTKTFSPFAGDGSDSPDKQIYELNNETQITGDTIRLFGFWAFVLERVPLDLWIGIWGVLKKRPEA